ncbi:hypothetical protein DIS12_04520 [Leuconostoc citreum]|uniref:hypothetical protein n=1 Tax=Leuconostoc citreum TaxID=33964 RepID=UPI001120D5B5|nr:hypothetical protein [Leuconostoc citreum]TOY70725.1 hypothetical protein DIS12_04520 [Leuconostoc citreum]
MYTVLDENLQVKGRLSLNNGNGATAFFSDTITTQMATDNANDPTGLTTVDYTNQDKQGNTKQWSHSLTVNVEATELGTSINTTDYLMYFDSVANHYYSMKVINATTDRNSGFITVSAINAAIFELGKQLIQAEQVYKQVDLKTFVSKMYKNAPFSLRIADDNLVTLDYTVSANTSLQALLQDLQTKFDVDVDSWVEVDETGHIVDRVLYFGHLGADSGELIRYGGAKGFENMTATEVSDIIYTKLYVTGKTDDKDPNKGHIGAVNNGLEYITDDDANQLMYAIGASQQQPVYLEGTITNNLLSEPKALLEWAKQQMGIFNHPRFNYTVSPLHDQIVAIGDTVTVQDFHVKPEILVTSKVIQKTTSFASPETNTFVLGEFSSIFTDNMNKGANVITLIKKDVTVVQEAADYAKAQADAAHAQAVIAQEQAIHAQTSADGKLTGYTADSVEDLPATANNGDIAWVTLNDGTHGYTYLNGKWVEDLNPTLQKDITDGVNKATSDAKAYADQAIATNGANVSASIKAVDDKANKLKSDQAVFDAKAQGYANQALNDSKANTSAAVQQTAKNATDALEQAKADLTGNIAKEATDRQNAVNALDKAAQGYANQAKSDAISAATTADGVINKKIDDTASGITATISQNKKDAEGKISTAQTTAQTAVDGLKTKVSQTDYDKKTGQLQTDLTSTTQTATQAKTDIVSIKQKDGDQDSRMNSIESDAKGTKQTISEIQTTQGKQSGSISTLQSRADSFDATVTKVNNLQVGGRNYFLNSSGNSLDKWNNYSGNWSIYSSANRGNVFVIKPTTTWTGGPTNSVSQGGLNNLIGSQVNVSFWAKSDINGGKFHSEPSGGSVSYDVVLTTTWSKYSYTIPALKTGVIYFMAVDAGTTYFLNNLKLEIGNTATDWTPAPEDVDSATAKAQLTADQAKTALSNYKTDADGRISKAQADITATAKQVQTKVSQTDYDQKTGELSTKVSTAQQTADSANTTIGDYKKANDGRVSSAESAIKQNTDAISSKVSQTDYDQKTGKLDGQISSLNQTAKDITTSIGKVSAQVNDLKQVNLVNNSQLTPDYAGWHINNPWGTDIGNELTNNGISDASGAMYVWHDQGNSGNWLVSEPIPVNGGQVVSESITAAISGSITSGVPLALYLQAYDSDKNRVLSTGYNIPLNQLSSTFTTFKFENLTLPQTARYASFVLGWNAPGKVSFGKPMLVLGSKVGDYVVGSYNNNSKLSVQQQKIESISSIVSDPNTGLTKRVQTAEGFMTSATDRLGKVENKSTSTADGLTREIKDRTDGDNNTLQQGKDFTTSQISNSESGMKSFVNQTISGLQIGAISSDVNALKLSTQWQTVNVDDLNNMTNQGKFFIQGGNHTNAPVGGWFYLTVDKPINGRITQVAWADSNPTMQYTRILFGSNWSNWNRVVTNETVLSIFNDSWSLGTSANDGITKKLITGINGQADGTLVVSGKSVILNSDTVIGNNFIIGSAQIANGAIGTAQIGDAAITSAKIANLDVSKLTGDTITGFNINANRQIYIASGGSLVSDVVNMDKNSFSVVAPNINSNRISAQGFNVGTTNGVFNIKSSAGVVSSDGKISVTYANQSSPYKNGTFHSEYGTNNLAFSATGYDNRDPDEYVNMSSAELDYMYSKTGFLSDATDHTSIRANLIETTGTLNAYSGAQIPNIYSYPNLILESKNQSVYFRSGGDYRLQIRENGYIYLWNKKFGSGGSSLQVAGDGALFIQSSATKFKEDIQYDGGTSVGDKFLTLDPATWQDKAEYEARAKYRKIGTEPDHQIHMYDKRYYGLIAEDLVKAGLEEFVVRDEKTGEVNGLEYDKVAISLIPVLREQRAVINELKVEIERLKDKVK